VVTLASDVAAVVSDLGLDAPAVVGHSLGGTTAVLFALMHRARAIVIVDQPLRPSDFAGRVRPLEARLRGDGFVDAMLEFEVGLGIGHLSAPAHAELEAAIRSVGREVVLGVWAQLFASSDDELDQAMSAVLPHLHSPLLSLHGSQPGKDYVDWLTGLVPHAEIEVWDGQGHFLHLVDPARFANRLHDLAS
jgi:pimeloyl-ACP methyl ester carboxylesterase